MKLAQEANLRGHSVYGSFLFSLTINVSQKQLNWYIIQNSMNVSCSFYGTCQTGDFLIINKLRYFLRIECLLVILWSLFGL